MPKIAVNISDALRAELAESCERTGRSLTAEVEARNDPKEEILRLNMRGNNYDRIVINDNSWRSVHPLGKDDVVLDWKPKKQKVA